MKDIFDVRTTASYIPLTEISDPLTLWKAISSAALWILLLVTGVPYEVYTSKKVSGRTIGIGLFFLTCAALFAWIGALIPTLYNPWVNFLALPAAQFAALFVMIRKLKPAREG